MLLICKIKISPNCQRIRSAHDRSPRSMDVICRFCAQELARKRQVSASNSDILHKLEELLDEDDQGSA